MRALEEYNEHARGEMRELSRQSQALDESGEAHAPAELAQDAEQNERRTSAPDLRRLNVASPVTSDVDMGGMDRRPVGKSARGGVSSSVNLSRDPRLRR
jgi:hypothetical protein